MSDDADRADELLDWYAEDDQLEGAEPLDEPRDTLTRYVVFTDNHAAVAATLWIATTHTLPAFDCAPRLVITSPEKRCGKTRLLDIVTGTCHEPLATSDASVAAIFRSLGGEHPPTLIIFEFVGDKFVGGIGNGQPAAEQGVGRRPGPGRGRARSLQHHDRRHEDQDFHGRPRRCGHFERRRSAGSYGHRPVVRQALSR